MNYVPVKSESLSFATDKALPTDLYTSGDIKHTFDLSQGGEVN